MEELYVQFNGQTYTLHFNTQTGYFEGDIVAPDTRWNIRGSCNISRLYK